MRPATAIARYQTVFKVFTEALEEAKRLTEEVTALGGTGGTYFQDYYDEAVDPPLAQADLSNTVGTLTEVLKVFQDGTPTIANAAGHWTNLHKAKA